MFTRKAKLYAFVFTVISLFSVFLAYISGVVKPILYSQSEAAVRMHVESSILSSLVNGVSGGVFTDPIKFSYNADGTVSGYTADMLAAAKLRALISENMITSLESDTDINLEIPLGTLSGIPFLYEHGPVMKVGLDAVSYASFNIASEFNDAGINQTLHRLILKVTVDTSLKAPLTSKKISVDTDIPISETVLIGDVPEAYTVIIRAHEEDEEDINDFAAEVEK
ncbi:MAG: sporulation protein YunB [Clostridia bacterium]|nr:sporulation protein YunB [Clostridia bacterium]